MRDFVGYYCNGKYQVGMTGTVWVYDMEDKLIGRFKETPYSYSGAFVPGTDIFVSHTNECHLVFYDIANMKLLKKIKTSNCDAAESFGLAFSNDGKLLYCVQALWDNWLNHRLVVYDTESFEVKAEYFDKQTAIVIQDVEIERDGTCYISARERGENEDRCFVGIFRDGELVERREFEEDWITVAMYFSWKRYGLTKKSAQWTVSPLLSEPHREPSSLKKLYETGHL